MDKLKQKAFRTKWDKLNIKITREMRDIIHGYIMSDGYVEESGILTIDQGIDQEKFVKWLYGYLSPICKKPVGNASIIQVVERTRGNTATYSKRFFTKSVCKGFHKMWYKPFINNNGQTLFKKKLPNNISGFFSPIFLSVWFAGDGTKILGSLGAKYEVTAWSTEERLKLKELFLTKYQIDVNINRAGQSTRGNEQWTLNINSNNYAKFRSLITEISLIEKLFSYKLHPRI